MKKELVSSRRGKTARPVTLNVIAFDPLLAVDVSTVILSPTPTPVLDASFAPRRTSLPLSGNLPSLKTSSIF